MIKYLWIFFTGLLPGAILDCQWDDVWRIVRSLFSLNIQTIEGFNDYVFSCSYVQKLTKVQI